MKSIQDQFRASARECTDRCIGSSNLLRPLNTGEVHHELSVGGAPYQIDQANRATTEEEREQWPHECVALGLPRFVRTSLAMWVESQEHHPTDPNLQAEQRYGFKIGRSKLKYGYGMRRSLRGVLGKTGAYEIRLPIPQTDEAATAIPKAVHRQKYFGPFTYDGLIHYHHKAETGTETIAENDVVLGLEMHRKAEEHSKQLDRLFEQTRAEIDKLRDAHNANISASETPSMELSRKWEERLREAMGKAYRGSEITECPSISLIRQTTQGGVRKSIDRQPYRIWTDICISDPLNMMPAALRKRISRLKDRPRTDDEIWEDALENTFARPTWAETSEKQKDGLYALVKLNRRPVRVYFLMDLAELAAISQDGIFSENANEILDATVVRAARHIEGDRTRILEAFERADLRLLTFRWPEAVAA